MTFQSNIFNVVRAKLGIMGKCRFNSKYYDYSALAPKNYECEEGALSSGFCIFHDRNYKNNKKRSEKIYKKIRTALEKDESLFFIGCHFPDIKIKENFANAVYFTKATFTDTDFSNSKFHKVDFSGAKFQNANFSKVFFEESDFLGVEFNGETDFSNTIFKDKVNFSESVFKKANFNCSTMKRAQFLGSKFQTADFSFTKIEDSDFYWVEFRGDANFVGTDIKRTVFPNSRFQGKTRFTGAKFEKTNFTHSCFGEADFDHTLINVMKHIGTTFSGDTNFFSSKLYKIDLHKVKFKKNSNFAESTLHDVTISDGKFQGNSNFAYVIFQDNVRFKNVEIYAADFSFAKFLGKAFFNDVLFRKQDRVNFDVDDLSKVSFRNTDVTKVRFGERVKWGGKNGFRIIDEELLNKDSEKAILQSVISTYRNLRKNYERRFRNEEAQKFFTRELELKKIYKKEDASITISDLEIATKKLEDVNLDLDELKDKVENLEKLAKRKLESEPEKINKKINENYKN